MKYPQLVVYEREGRVADLLRRRLEDVLWREGRTPPGWLLYERRQTEACLRQMRRGGPAVLVVRLGSNLPRELGLVDRVSRLHPDVQVVVVGEDEDPVLAGLAWDVGASYVHLPPQPRDLLPEVVRGLMAAAADRLRAAAPGGADCP